MINRNIAFIMGVTKSYEFSDECGCAYKTEPEKDMGKISISYTNSIVKPDERKYLRTLPVHTSK